jgi:capsular polysaccharide biosynthesis protein
MKSMMLGLLGGLAAGLGLVYALDMLDRSVKTVDQAEATLGLPVLAAIPGDWERGWDREERQE